MGRLVIQTGVRDAIHLGDEVKITVTAIRRGKVSLVVDAPESMDVSRKAASQSDRSSSSGQDQGMETK